MYDIGSVNIISFIEDQTVKLPRFQRKQTWDDKRNFELCISVFKEFPMGVCILNLETDARGRTTKWLLDGRQRHNALQLIWDDPETIHQWAKKWVGFKNSDQPADLAEKYWVKIREYLEDDEDEEEADSEPVGDSNREEVGEIVLDEDEASAEADDGDQEITVDLTKQRLDFLLEVIQLIHNKTAKHSGFTRPFDFTQHIANLPYMETAGGKTSLSCRKLKTFINEYEQWCKNESEDVEQRGSFRRFYRPAIRWTMLYKPR